MRCCCPPPARITRIDEEQAEPLLLNSQLGTYTNFVNLLDLAAVAVPAGFTAGGPALRRDAARAAPGRTKTCCARRPAACRGRSARWAPPACRCRPTAAPPRPRGTIDIAVCGAHMSGLPLNHQLTERGAWLVSRPAVHRNTACMRCPAARRRPGLVRVAPAAWPSRFEIWRMPEEHFGSFMRGIPAPLGIGRVRSRTAPRCAASCARAWASTAPGHQRLGGWRHTSREALNTRRTFTAAAGRSTGHGPRRRRSSCQVR